MDANGQNITGDAANEPSICVDPTNPNRMAIGWRQFNSVASNFRQSGWGYTSNGGTDDMWRSMDGGQSWLRLTSATRAPGNPVPFTDPTAPESAAFYRVKGR